MPEGVEHWSLTALREKLVKIGAIVVRHGRLVTFQHAEVANPRTLFADNPHQIEWLRPMNIPSLRLDYRTCCHATELPRWEGCMNGVTGRRGGKSPLHPTVSARYQMRGTESLRTARLPIMDFGVGGIHMGNTNTEVFRGPRDVVARPRSHRLVLPNSLQLSIMAIGRGESLPAFSKRNLGRGHL